MYKRVLSCLLCMALLATLALPAGASASEDTVLPTEGSVTDVLADRETIPVISTNEIQAQSAILIEQTTGQVLFEMNADIQLSPASGTKIMTMLLVMESIESGRIALTDTVTCSDHASSMGGTQIWFAPGETLTVDELLKATAISSANDAAVALAEHIAGSEDAFVTMMNARAKELGMMNTSFMNACGLDEEGHLTSARDIALMSQALLTHPLIIEYSTIWMDYLRDGQTELVNTNKLVRLYEGITGLKTGTTDDAGYCLSASATRSGMSLIAVVLGCPTSQDRFAAARSLLDYGFANFAVVQPPALETKLEPIRVLRGVEDRVALVSETPSVIVIPKGDAERIEQQVTLDETVTAPVEPGQRLGSIQYFIDGEVICAYDVTAASGVNRMTFGRALGLFMTHWVSMVNI